MRFLVSFQILITLALGSFGQKDSAYVYFGGNWKQDSMSKHHTWIINNHKLIVNKDTTSIALSKDGFDTIVFSYYGEENEQSVSLAKFKRGVYYEIREIPCTDYDVVPVGISISMDYSVRFKVENYDGKDTLVGSAGYRVSTPINNQFGDVIPELASAMCANTRRRIGILSLESGKYAALGGYVREEPGIEVLAELNFQFLHNEHLNVVYDFQENEIFLEIEK